jgi:hypothetical protein
MTSLETLKQKLMIKPKAIEREPVIVHLSLNEDIANTLDKTTRIIDKTKEAKTFDREAILQKLNKNKLVKVSRTNAIIQPIAEPKETRPEELIKEKKLMKKPIKLNKPIVILDDDTEDDEEEEVQNKPILEKPKKHVIEEKVIENPKKRVLIEDSDSEIEDEDKNEDEDKSESKSEDELRELTDEELFNPSEEEIKTKTEPVKKRTRVTKKAEKGIAILGPETNVIIGDTYLAKRVPKIPNPVNIKVSSYYMNNREIFVNFISSLFHPYKEEIESNLNVISCDDIGKTSGNFSLLTHQKIVRDYINLYTPYRGLLLYHGLGSGKSCTSIAIAEGMKNNKRVIIMLPASLRANYIEELKKCGDLLYKRNQYWEWVSTVKNPTSLEPMSAVLNLPVSYIEKRKGAWFINIKKNSNYSELTDTDKKALEDQLNEMIKQKYTFINYNGLRTPKLKELTDGFTKNLFDDCVVIIDEAHNLISRIVNKIKKEKPIVENKRGEKEHLPVNLASKLYEYLLSAKNAKIVLLTGTPVINYPNEFSILFNILRGYIKTWKIPLDIKTNKKVDRNSLYDMLNGEKTMDFLDYSPSSKMLTVTRNPFGFKNQFNKEAEYQGVSNNSTTEYFTDDEFERRLISTLRKNDIEIMSDGVEIQNKKALPDTLDLFLNNYIDFSTNKLKNLDSLKRRIIGLSSFFRSAQENLLPRYNKEIGVDYFVVSINMSDYQFKIYESARIEERKMEKPSKKPSGGDDGLFKDASSTYRIFSRLFCNYVMPDRPYPDKKSVKDKKQGEYEENIKVLLKEAEKEEAKQDVSEEQEGEIEGDEILNAIGGIDYQKRLEDAIKYLEENSNEFLSKEGLKRYSPKFLHILENITDDEYLGLHLVYSQFRTAEGIGLFSLVLNKNGFSRFKIKKSSSGSWEIDMREEDMGKPTYALYTGTETSEEKEIIRHIYNGEWSQIPDSISTVLKQRNNNNNMGEVIKVLMITSSGSEGINLRNTRYVHIMEPYWHPVRLEQVIGRARRICSHKDLPVELQTVNVFVYLMQFTPEQLKSDESVELKRKDLSKGIGGPKVPFTSDQYLYEISQIKANLTGQLTDAIKESSFDCNIYSNGKCFNFGDVNNSTFSFVPDYAQQQGDTIVQANKKKIEWVGREITIADVKYVYREINKNLGYIYDYASYNTALTDPSINPLQIGTLEKTKKGELVFKRI